MPAHCFSLKIFYRRRAHKERSTSHRSRRRGSRFLNRDERQNRAFAGDDDLEPFPGIGGAADDLMNAIFGAFIDLQNMEVVAIGVLLAREDFADDEVRGFRHRENVLDFDAGEGELIGQLLRGDIIDFDELNSTN
jgi:hypothetical protein